MGVGLHRLRSPEQVASAAEAGDFDRAGVGFIAALTALLLLAVSGRYGYHRDELYFIAAGHHLAFGYPDQPPLTPFLARLMTDINAKSLVVLRLPSDMAAAVTVLATGGIARELGARATGQRLAAISIGIGAFTLGSGHLLSTSTPQLTAWALLMLLVLRAIRTGNEKLWLLAGLVAGIGLQGDDLVAFLAVALGVGALISGPRRIFRSPWLWAGVVIAVAIWSPYLVWQAQHGYPELKIARSIAHGGSGTSAPRWAIPVEQLELASPVLVPMWIYGLIRLLRNGPLRWARAFGLAYFVVLAIFVVTGGKPYYLANMFPLLLAAGAQPAWDWGIKTATRRWTWIALLGVGLAINALITLDIVPAADLHKTTIPATNYDAGETVGWPAFVAEIGGVFQAHAGAVPGTEVVLAANYGEAGAVDRYGASYGMAVAYSGNNAFWLWGPPPPQARTVIAVGFSRDRLLREFTSVTLATRLNNHDHLNDGEQDEPVMVCTGLVRPWATAWRSFQDYSG